MARRTVFDDSSDDEFPEIHALGYRNKKRSQVDIVPNRAGQNILADQSAVKSTIRRRKLAQITDNALLRPWNESGSSAAEGKPAVNDDKRSKSRIQLRKRAQRPVISEIEVGDQSCSEEPSINMSSEDDFSDFHTALDSELDEDDFFTRIRSARSPKRTLPPGEEYGGVDSENSHPRKEPLQVQRLNSVSSSSHVQRPATPPKRNQDVKRKQQRQQRQQQDVSVEPFPAGSVQWQSTENMLTATSFKLQTEELDFPRPKHPPTTDRPVTPTVTPPRVRAGGLVSPKKLSRIPMTPHRPSTDTFWSQEFVDEWNDEHSPKKTAWPSEVSKSPSKKSPTRKAGAEKAARKAFESAKHALADSFLQELDQAITNGQLQKLAESTGGIKINWTNKLNTTAGRANWKRETIKIKTGDGDEVVTKHRHHASIELAEKVIDDEDRLLNVIAHEFCHLANFMVSGMTTNPHGKEFKAWASKCSRRFGHRGIEVTTKHTYDIVFKYIWECTDCSMEFKRHSKSINPERHRCGSCKGELKQTKPIPRVSTKTSDYQKFMRAQMKIVKEQNPTSPQKDIMRIVADKWSRKDKLLDEKDQDANVTNVADVLVQLTLEDKH